jgi:small subunit ribosomal protein S8
MSSINVCDGVRRINNAYSRSLPTTLVKKSKFLKSVMDVLQSEGYIESYEEEGNFYRVTLRYTNDQPALRKIKLVSKPSCRIYGPTPKPFYCFGIMIVSTNKGVMAGYKARKLKLGGEILMEVF